MSDSEQVPAQQDTNIQESLDFIGNGDENDSIIKDQDKLSVDYIPQNLLYRGEKIKTISDLLYKRTYKYNLGDHLIIVGPTGTGKTASTKLLHENFREKNDRESIHSVYVNCEGNPNKQSFFESVMAQLDLTYKEGVGVSENLKRLYKYLTNNSISLILTIDEIDALRRAHKDYMNSILYKLVRPTDIYEKFDADIKIAVISNDLEIRKDMNDSVDSSFGDRKLAFKDYEKEEITKILMKRQSEALSETIITEKEMRIISNGIIDDFEGDIRSGIKVLKDAIVQFDEEDDPTEISSETKKEVLRNAVREVKKGELETYLEGADKHLKLVMWAYVSSGDKGEFQFKPIYERYKTLCELSRIRKSVSKSKSRGDGIKKIRSNQYVRRKLNDLHENNIINKHVDYERNGAPSLYSPMISLEVLEDVVMEKVKQVHLYDSVVHGKIKRMESDDFSEEDIPDVIDDVKQEEEQEENPEEVQDDVPETEDVETNVSEVLEQHMNASSNR